MISLIPFLFVIFCDLSFQNKSLWEHIILKHNTPLLDPYRVMFILMYYVFIPFSIVLQSLKVVSDRWQILTKLLKLSSYILYTVARGKQPKREEVRD